MNRTYFVLILLAVVALIISSATFTVHERERAIKLALGEIVEADFTPGLYFKVPFYNTVRRFDGRILTLDARPERVLTSEKKNVIVDSFMKWKIGEVERYFRATGGDERRALGLLAQFVGKAVRDAFGKRTVQEVISGERAELMTEVQQAVQKEATALGIEVTDVRVKKVELPDGVSDSVFSRMEKERATVAKAFRSRGEEQARGIRADAERQREEILAEAYSESQEIRGEGDATATEVYAQAYNRNAEFYRLYRSLNAYQNTIGGEGDLLVIRPDSEFFRYFNQSSGN
ncbi:MAG: protease modulator HflC [Pseudomonadota bacterium]